MNVLQNKKGFTLIELLAVIAILAVIMLIGGQSVFGALDQARKGSFKTEAVSAIQAAQAAYQIDLLNGNITSKSKCYSIQELINKSYYEKNGNDKDDYIGSVLVSTDNIGAGTASYTIWLKNKQYQVVNGTLSNLNTQGDAGSNGTIEKVSASGMQVTTDCSFLINVPGFEEESHW